MPEIRHFSLDTDAQTLADAVKEDGAIIIDDVLSPEFITELRTETDPYMEGSNLGFDDFAGFKTARTGGLMVRSQKCRELIAHPNILAPCKLFLEPYCQTVQLHLTQIIRIGPGETAQLIHRDRWAWGSHLAHVEPQFNTIWAITDFTSENGATQVVPGSTQWPDDVQIEPEQVTQAEMRAGSVLVYSGSVFHGGGENQAREPRTGLAIHYGLGWLRQEENQFLACSHETARSLPERLQALLGYQLAAPSFGFADHVHPRDYLNGIRDPAKSDVSSQDLIDRHSGLTRLEMTATPPERSRYYEAE